MLWKRGRIIRNDLLVGIAAKKIAVFFLFFGMVINAVANPVGGAVSSGSANITQAPGNTQINQSSDKAIINWQSFNIGASEKTQFNQPSASSVTLNRISPQQGASQIFGQLISNGKIILVNQAGIFFGPSAHVNVGGIIASATDITDANFNAGRFIFDQHGNFSGTIVNQGTIIAADHGLVALIGNNVSNNGVIQARLGNIVLASGNKFTVDLYGDQLINFSVDEGIAQSGKDQNGNVLKDAVSNSGTLLADGGTVMMTAKTAQGVVDNVINMSGVVQARSVSQQNGEIILGGGDQGTVLVSGKLDASGYGAGQKGGKN